MYVVIYFVDIGGILNHDCLNCLSIMLLFVLVEIGGIDDHHRLMRKRQELGVQFNIWKNHNNLLCT